MNAMNDLVNNLWAKTMPYRSLIDHMIDTGKCASELLKESTLTPVSELLCECLGLNEEQMRATVGYIAAMHDIGKCHPLFQVKDPTKPVCEELMECGMLHNQLPHDEIKKFRHERYTYYVMCRLHEELTDDDFWMAVFRALSLHHQGKHGDKSKTIPAACNPAAWEQLQNNLAGMVRDTFHPVLDLGQINCKLADAATYMILGITILSDWIASDRPSDGDSVSTAENLLRRGLKAAGRLPESDDFCRIWPLFQRNRLRGVQKAVEALGEKPSAFYIIEAPMGEGKTEAALYLAARQCWQYHKTGFYVALPTAATGNQMFYRVRNWLIQHDTGKARLLHSTAWMVEDDTPDENIEISSGDEVRDDTVSQWLAPLRMGLLSQFAIGTVDQAMMAVLNVKYGILRLLGLSGKVLVIDEIHAYDTYMQTIIERLLSWCRALSVPVILLSATLPQGKKQSLISAYMGKNACESNMSFSSDYPLITYIGDDNTVKQEPVGEVFMRRCFAIETRPYYDDAECTAELAISLTASGGCICVLVNTVKKAQRVYSYLLDKCAQTDLMLFHARFPTGTRQEIEKKCTSTFGKEQQNRPKAAILVATQVMEQSIDADFDAMITDLAPIDLLLQRMGRVHRFENTHRPTDKEIPKIYILTSDSGYAKQSVYSPFVMERTESLIQSKEAIRTPDQIRECVEQVYSEEIPDEKEQFQLWAKQQFKAQLESATAEGVLMDEPDDEYPTLSDKMPDMMFEDDETSLLAAKTRLGEESTRIILLSSDELSVLSEYPDKQTARKLLLRSVSIRSSQMGAMPSDAVKGKGLLKGFVLLPQEHGRAEWNDYSITDDPVLGILIERKNGI